MGATPRQRVRLLGAGQGVRAAGAPDEHSEPVRCVDGVGTAERQLAANVARVLPEGMGAVLDRSTWTLPPVFSVLAGLGVAQDELERTFNVGVGMAVVLHRDDVAEALGLLGDRGVPAWQIGHVAAGETTRVVGAHPA